MMSAKEKKTELFNEFPSIGTLEWEAKILEDLKGADYQKKLVWTTNDGILINPYYRIEDLKNLKHNDALPNEFPFTRGNSKSNNSWVIRQDIETDNIIEANKTALIAIKNGVESIGFNAKNITNINDLSALLENIEIEKVEINFYSAKSYTAIGDLFVKEAISRKVKLNKLKGSFNFDSLSFYLVYGKFYTTMDNDFVELSNLINTLKSEIPNFKVININGQNIHNAGATIAQELGFSLASGNEYLYQLTSKGLKIDEITPKIQFTFGIGSDYFLEIAKIRAARLLWAKIVEQYQPISEQSCSVSIHSETSKWNKTLYDPHVNMLRITTEAMSAAIGGCDSMTVNSFNNTFKKADEFSYRNARNIQLILKEESYFDKTIDPAGGSYYIEILTDELAEASWKIFQTIETQGGYIEALKSGFIMQEIENSNFNRKKDVSSRKKIFLGTNQFPNLEEKMLDNIEPHASLTDLGELRIERGSKDFETIRMGTEAHIKAGYNCPKVFLLTIGNLVMSKARASFMTNFFGCGGFEIIDNLGFKTVEKAVNAALKTNSDIVVICSSDEEYTEFAPEICNLFNKKSPETIIIIAGNPVNKEELKNAGVDDFIGVKSNVLETLARYQVILGI
jgi:methylmalonyl-CoA mutase